MSKNLLEKLKELNPLIGNTPLVPIPYASTDTCKIYGKLECYNMLDNIKSRPAYYMIEQGILDGKIDQDTTIIESSSGNLGISLGIICKALGLKFIPVIDPNINPAYEKILHRLATHVEKVTIRDDTNGYLKTRLKKISELQNTIPNNYWTNQYENTNNYLAHYNNTGLEIINSNIRFDYVFIAVSTTGTITGISNRIKESLPSCKIIAVDIKGSHVFSNDISKRHIPGIGSSIHPKFLKDAQCDDKIIIDEYEGISGCWHLLNEHTLFVGGSSGCVWAAYNQYSNLHHLSGNILLLFPDGGYPYLDTIYNPEWVKDTFGKTL